MAERRHVLVHGNVQGVFFRESTRVEAQRRGVGGWAKNLADGTVEAVFEGSTSELDAMIEFVRRGPGHSTVVSIEVRSETPEGLSGFSVR